MASCSRSARNTAGTSTSTSFRRKAVNPNGSRGIPAAMSFKAGRPTASRSSSTPPARATRRAAPRASGRCPWKAESRHRCRCRARIRARSRPTARRVAYRMNNSWDEERRNYRGGQNRPIWIVDLKTFDLETTPNGATDLVVAQAGSPRGPSHFSAPTTPESKNMDPVWVDSDIVDFISDRDGVANVWSYDTKSKKLAAADELQRLRRQDARRRVRWQRGGVRAGGQHPLTRSEVGQGARRQHHRGRRFPVDDAARGRT